MKLVTRQFQKCQNCNCFTKSECPVCKNEFQADAVKHNDGFGAPYVAVPARLLLPK